MITFWRSHKFTKKIYNFCKFSTKYDTNISVGGVSLENYVKHLEDEYHKAPEDPARRLELQPFMNLLDERRQILDNLVAVSELSADNDEDLRKLAQQEEEVYKSSLKSLDHELVNALVPVDKQDICDSIVLEINTGVGGQEAMLFASELFEMYSNFAMYKGWQWEVASFAGTDLGGIRHGSALINGKGAYRHFKHEAGVHRVQRIPTTEKSSRIHTSTVSVLALPQPNEIQINIENKDLKFESKRASGAGGQHVNTTDSAVRITHLPTGIMVECQVDRSQLKNRTIALAKLRALLYQKQLDAQLADNIATRKSQVRSNYRNEKIRTYNFPQDRITDHRVQMTVHNLKGFFVGNSALENLIDRIDAQDRLDRLLELLKDFNK